VRKGILVYALLSSMAAFAGEKMTVSVCNPGQLPASVVVRAEEQAGVVFRAIDVEVEWQKCGEGAASAEAAHERRFEIRLRNDAPPKMAGPSSLEAMGRAYVPEEGTGFMADAYFRSVQLVAGADSSDVGALLGCVMSHELGHLLLGPGHVPNGIMRAAWKPQDVDAARKRSLKFNSAQGTRIRGALKAETGSEAVGAQ
jgi:hypothetical protein